jgi:hypothetical protein
MKTSDITEYIVAYIQGATIHEINAMYAVF